MNISKILLIGAFVGMGLTSCTNEESYLEESTESGTMSLSVEKVMPQAKSRAVETADFPIAVYRKSDNLQVAAYDNLSQMPERVQLSTGFYYATAHTPGTMEKIMDTPYYFGSEDFEIVKGTDTEATITCRMANGRFNVNFSADFQSVFASWTITIDDGGSTAIIYTSDNDGTTPSTKYMRFEDNVSTITVNFKGTTVTGNRIVTSNYLTKQNASEQYDDDNENFSGGDAIVINFNPVESTDGEITGITINANISFEETTEDFELEVKDAVITDGGGDSGDGSGDNTGGEEAGPITLDLPEDQVITGDSDPSLGDTYIKAESGISSLKVRVTSTSQEMIGSLLDVGEYVGVNLTEDTEVVENDKMVDLFTQLGKSLTVPTAGDKEYTFPIGDFFSLLAVLTGDHSFHLTVTDLDGNTKSGTIVLTVE